MSNQTSNQNTNVSHAQTSPSRLSNKQQVNSPKNVSTLHKQYNSQSYIQPSFSSSQFNSQSHMKPEIQSQSLLKTRTKEQVQTQEQNLKQKARTLKHKLEQTKLKHQSNVQKCLKDKLTEHYQQNFNKFKQQLEEQFKSQCCALQLIKQLKMNQIEELEQTVRTAISYLEKNREQTDQYESQLKRRYEDGLEWLNKQMQREKDEARQKLQAQSQERIRIFRNSIKIQ